MSQQGTARPGSSPQGQGEEGQQQQQQQQQQQSQQPQSQQQPRGQHQRQHAHHPRQQQHQQPPKQQQQQQQQQQQRPPEEGGLPQLPPQMFTTAAQLLDMTDKKLVLVLRDGRKLIGILRSWDQYANLVLQDTVERIYAGGLFAEQKRGVYIVRGENVLLLGEIDLDKEDDLPPNCQPGDWKHVSAIKEKEEAERERASASHGRRLHGLGFEREHSGDQLF